jgi:Flp pilus assembly protein TadG
VKSNRHFRRRSGKVLALLVLLLPVLLGLTGLVIDGGLLLSDGRNLQSIADAAATTAAFDLLQGKSSAEATAAAIAAVQIDNELPDAQVTVHIPPSTGPYAGSDAHAEVLVERQVDTFLVHLVGVGESNTVSARAVAGHEAVTAGAAVVVLDPNPGQFSLLGVTLPIGPLPTVLAGVESIGISTLEIGGAVLVNTEWGGVDENGDPAGNGEGPPYGVTCTPILPVARLTAEDIRVVGGVDNPSNYGHLDANTDSPLACNVLPVPDPFADLPVPTLAADPTNVSSASYGGVQVAGLPLLGPPVTLDPGVYDWIAVVSGQAHFNPGVYVIRGKHPVTGISLNVIAGEVQAQGAMFYITDSAAYDVATGLPDANDGETSPGSLPIQSQNPSVLINAGLIDSHFGGLDDPGSPFDGLTIYQRRQDRRAIVIAHEDLLLGAGSFAGTVYAKWGHVILTGNGTYQARFVAGTLRCVNVLGMRIAPDELLPPARDVFLVE